MAVWPRDWLWGAVVGVGPWWGGEQRDPKEASSHPPDAIGRRGTFDPMARLEDPSHNRRRGGLFPADEYDRRVATGEIDSGRPGCVRGRSSPVTKFLPMTGMVVSGLIGILFVADLAVAQPFQRKDIALDVGFLVASLIVGYLSWSVLDTAKT